MSPRVDFNADSVRDKARRDILHALEAVRGKKNLVIDRGLVGPIGVVVKVTTLQEYGVDKFFILENKNVDTSQRNVVFLARSESGCHVRDIADQVKRLQRASKTGHEFHLLWVPRRTLVSDRLLEEAGVLGDLNISELSLFFFPLEKDVFSLELDESYRDLFLRRESSSAFLMARALMDIQQRHGLFPRIIGKGVNAKLVADLLSRMRQELLAGEDAATVAGIDLTPSTTAESVIIIDREVDVVTPLLTQLTYEGLIDELFGIQNNQTRLDTTAIAAAPSATITAQPSASSQCASSSTSATVTSAVQSRKRPIQLDSSDALYSQLRDSNFAVIGGQLNMVAKRLQKFQIDYEIKHKTLPLAELKDFVNQLPAYQAEQQSVATHSGIAEDIIKYTRSDEFKGLLAVQQNLIAGADPSSQVDAIEELVSRGTPMHKILRLLCIYSCVSGGVNAREFDQFRRLVQQAYGYQHILTLYNLQKMQLFLPRTTSSAIGSLLPMAGAGEPVGARTDYAYLRKQLRLIMDEVKEDDPNDIAYTYSGYAPLSVRLVQCVLQKQYLLKVTKGNGVTSAPGAVRGEGGGPQGWHGFDEAVKHVRGPTFYKVQKGEEKAVKTRAMMSSGVTRQTVFVVFVGGVTFTEISALRFIAHQEEARRQIVICTTSIISGNKMMDAAVEKGTYSLT